MARLTDKIVMGHGSRTAKIMIVQGYPKQTESTRSKYMVGKSGRLLLAGLSEVGIDVDEVFFTGTYKSSTLDDEEPSASQIKEHLDYLYAELDVINPEVIIPVDNIALKALTRKTGITKHRGKIFLHEIEGKEYDIFPLISPSIILRQPKHMELFSKDLITLGDYLSGESTHKSYSVERLYCEDIDTALNELDRINNLPKGSFVSFDLETVKTNPFLDKVSSSKKTLEKYPDSVNTKIVALGFSDRSGYGMAMPLFHRQTPFNSDELDQILEKLELIFTNENLELVAQNGKFDMRWLRAKHKINVSNFRWDTMLMHYIAITEEQGTHGLSDLAWLETDMGGYDDELKKVEPKGQDKGNYDLIDWEVLKYYLAGDCDVTFRIFEKYKKHFKEGSDFRWIWENLMLPGSEALLNIESNGMFVDREWLTFLEEQYPIEIKRIEEKLHEFPEVLEMERERKDMWDERVAIGQIKKANRTDEQQDRFVKWKKYDPSKGGIAVNFGSFVQVGELLFDRLGLKTVILTDTGNPSTNDESLIYMKDQHPICEMMLEFRKVNHLYNNFVAGIGELIDKNDLVHPSYNLHGTVTGRLSSSEPNGQQIPRVAYDPLSFQYNHEIKRLFTSRFGDEGCILQLDYSQLELRILGVYSQDKNLIEQYNAGADLHKATASGAFNTPIDEVTSEQRTAAKAIAFGIVYQESPRGLSEDLRAQGIDMSEEECATYIDNYLNRFPGVNKWIKGIKRTAQREKQIVTLTGRIRRLHTIDSTDQTLVNMALRQSVNAPIQSFGSDCTLQAVIQIDKWLNQMNKRSVIAATVHDSIVLDCPKDEALEVAKKAKHIMENLAEYNEFYSILGNIPIVSDLEIGYNYGEIFEAEIEDLEELGIDGFVQGELAKKKENEEKAYKSIEEKGGVVPPFVHNYWNEIKK